MSESSRANRQVVSVTGANGGIARSLLAALVEQYSVKALVRNENENSRRWAEAGCEIVVGDLRDGNSLNKLIAGADLVFHCAAKLIGTSPAEFEEVNVQGTKTLLDAVVGGGCRRFIHISSNAVYGAGEPTSDGEYNEETVLEASDSLDSYTRTKLLAEKAVIEACGNSAVEYTILRPTGVYGPHVQSWTLLPLGMIRKGRRLFIGFDETEGLFDAVYIEDLVQAILLAAQDHRAAGEVFNIGNELISFNEFYALLGEMADRSPRLGSEAKVRRMSAMMRRLSRLWPGAAEIERGMEMALRMSLSRCRYPSTKARERLNYSPRFALPMGMLRTELVLREEGILPRRKRPIPNADHHYSLRPQALIRPTTEEQIVQAVREAEARQIRLKAIGALHSFVPIPETEGICVALDRFKRIVSVEGSWVTVQPGITIAELNEELKKHRRVLPIQGSHAAQTIAGAISTSTHGGSLHHGTLADQVERIRLVRANGKVEEIESADPLFHAVVVSLGLLGVISSVTLRCVPEFYLRSDAKMTSIEQYLEDFDSIQRQNDYVDALYHPQTRQVEMLLMNRVEVPDNDSQEPSATLPAFNARRKLISFVFQSLMKVLNTTRSESLNGAVLKRVIGTSYRSGRRRCNEALGFSDLSAGEPFPIDDLEFAIPYSDAKRALHELSENFERERNFPRFFPIHIRCSKAGGHWLSPNYKRDVCWIEFWQYPPNPGLYDELAAFFDDFRCRLHWAKLGAIDKFRLCERYERWNDFAQLRREWDPKAMFLNERAAQWFS